MEHRLQSFSTENFFSLGGFYHTPRVLVRFWSKQGMIIAEDRFPELWLTTTKISIEYLGNSMFF